MTAPVFRRMAWQGLALGLLVGQALAGNVEVKPLLARMPARTAAEEQAVFGELIKGGPEAVQAVCAKLAPPGKGGDSSARYLLGGLAFYAARPGAEAERRLCSDAMLEALRKVPDPEIKSFLLGLLRWCGGPECLAPLGVCLREPNLVEPATQALLAIRAPGTAAVLLPALKKARGNEAVTLVKALGELRAPPAVPALVELAAGADADLRPAALRALAEIGPRERLLWTDYSAGDALRRACRTGDAREKALAANLYLRYARRLAEYGARARGAAVCREVLALGAAPGAAHLRPAALNTLAAVCGEQAIPDLVAAVNSSNRTDSVSALHTLLAMPGAQSTGALNQILASGPDHLRIALLNALAGANSPAFSGAVAANLKHSDVDVRTAAIQTLHGKQGLASLLDLLPSASADELLELKKHILALADKKDLPDIAAVLAKAPALAQVVILDILSQRRAIACVTVVLGAAASADPAVRLAAMKALGTTAAPAQLPQMMALALKSTAADEQAAALRAVVAVAKVLPEAEQRAGMVLDVYPNAPAGIKAQLLGVLPELGGQQALETVTGAVTGPEDSIRNAAVGALANWPDQAAAATMLQAAAVITNLTHQALLLRGFVRLVRESGQPDTAKLGRYQEALAAARRSDEKKIILGALVDVKTLAALQLLDKYLDDPELRDEAASVAVLVACPEGNYKGLTDPAARPVLVRMAGVIKDEPVRKKVEAHLAGIKKE
ncbi:MAG: hypothetical protein NTV49_15885 [Kiritimatiellaeota bacterium]|nr:hypothetical protein [Kiritimatiellota bacterium]